MRTYLVQCIAAIGGRNSVHKFRALVTSFLAAHKNVLEFVVFFLVYLPWAFLQLKLKLETTSNYFSGVLEQNHHLLLLFQYTNNEQSRLLQWLVPEAFIHLFHLSIVQAYMLQRLIFIFLAFLCFHFYLRKWFTVGESFAGVAAMAAIMPLTYLEDLQESSCLLLLTFLLGLWAIRSHKTFVFIIVLSIGLLNNETMAILPLAYFFYEYRSLKFSDIRPLLGKMVVVALPIFFILLPIRYITRNRPHLGGEIYNLPVNLHKMYSDLSVLNIFNIYNLRNLYIFPIFGVLWIFAFIHFQGKPFFLKRVTYMIPFFVFIHFLTGEISEVRQMLPLSFIIIPTFLFYWKSLSSQKRNLVKAGIQEKSSSREKSSSQGEREDVEPRSSSFWLLLPCVLLLASVISFLLEKSFFSEAKSGESRHSRKEFFVRRAKSS
jgi:hypothetical protein